MVVYGSAWLCMALVVHGVFVSGVRLHRDMCAVESCHHQQPVTEGMEGETEEDVDEQ